jgi:hypothetical protein
MSTIETLLQELDDAVVFGNLSASSRVHLVDLCRRSAVAIRQLQVDSTRSHLDAHANFLLQLAGGLTELGRRLQGHA